MVQKNSTGCPFEHINNPEQEAEQVAEITKLTVGLLDKRYPWPDKVLRGVHPKSHGCVKAVFEINQDLDQSLQVGLFNSPGKKYDATIRFSNAAARLGPDISDKGEHGSRGMAIKVFNVASDVLLEDDGACNQDFLMINQPVFAFANTEDYLRLTRIIHKNNDDPKAFFAPLTLQDPRVSKEQKEQVLKYIEAENISEEDIQRIFATFNIVQQIQSDAVANPLNIQYFSAAPFLFGQDRVMKFSVKPVNQVNPTEIPTNPSADYLRSTLSESMSQKQAIEFDFMVQVRNDEADDMGIENASSLWDEEQFPFVKVAKMTIPTPQSTVDSMDSKADCEKLAFTPWHSLADHQPIGSINRLRKDVYQASAEYRTKYSEADNLPLIVRLVKRFFKILFG